MQISPEIWVAIIIGTFQLVATVLGLAWAISKFPSERVAINAEANSDNAAADKSKADAHATLLATYLKTFEQLQLRDAEYLRLNREMSAVTQRVNTLEESQRLSSLDLDTERERRAAAERERDNLRTTALELTAQVETLSTQVAQIPALRKEIEELRLEIDHLKPNNGFKTSSGI